MTGLQANTVASSAVVREGYRRAKALTRHHAKSFFFSSIALFGARRRGAFALYAFCRRLDDLVDGENRGDGTVAAPSALPSQLAERLALARIAVATLYGRGDESVWRRLPWHPSEVAAVRDVVQRYGIPERPFQELISGMEMDLTQTRYETFDALSLYCYRVAGVVGEMMTPVLGHVDDRCLPSAADLGIAMQLTNILRDVKEDLVRGRVYLPARELAAFGLTELQLTALASGHSVAPDLARSWAEFMRFQVLRARALYARAEVGIPDLRGFGSQRLVRLMRSVYAGILDVIEARAFDVFSQRASTSFGSKCFRAISVLLTANPSVQRSPPPLPTLDSYLAAGRVNVLPEAA